MKIFIPIHSVVDVITNSSSVIYTDLKANSVELMKALINDVLAAAGSDKTAEDLFTFELTYRPEDLDYWVEEYQSEADEDSQLDIPADLQAAMDATGGTYTERRKEIARLTIAHSDLFQPIWDKLGQDNYYESYPRITRYMKVETRDGTEIDLAGRVLSMFDIEGGYSG